MPREVRPQPNLAPPIQGELLGASMFCLAFPTPFVAVTKRQVATSNFPGCKDAKAGYPEEGKRLPSAEAASNQQAVIKKSSTLN